MSGSSARLDDRGDVLAVLVGEPDRRGITHLQLSQTFAPSPRTVAIWCCLPNLGSFLVGLPWGHFLSAMRLVYHNGIQMSSGRSAYWRFC